MLSSEVLHASFLFPALSGATAILTVIFRFTGIRTDSCSGVMPVTACCTVTWIWAFSFDSGCALAAVIIALPGAMPVTVPSAPTVATSSLEELQITSCHVASSGVTVQVSFVSAISFDAPTRSTAGFSLMVIFFTGISALSAPSAQAKPMLSASTRISKPANHFLKLCFMSSVSSSFPIRLGYLFSSRHIRLFSFSWKV